MKLFVIGLILTTLFSESVVAQEIQRFPRSTQDSDDLKLEEELNFPTFENIISPTLESQQSVAFPAPFVRAVEFQIIGNTVISDDELQNVVRPYLNVELNNEDLRQILEEIDLYYSEKGYLGVGTFITGFELTSDSSLNQAIIKLQVVERIISDIRITGAKRLTPYIRKRVRKYINEPFNSNAFENEMRFLLDKETIESIRAEFIQTDLENEARLQMDVTLGDIVGLSATLDNQQSTSSGEFGQSLDFFNRNLTGNGDILNLEYKRTEGSHFGDITYEIPINTDDGSVSISALFERSSIIQEPIDDFDLDSETFRFRATYRQPIIQKSNDLKLEEAAIGVGVSRIDTSESLDDTAFPLSAGSNLEGKFRSTVLNFFQEYLRKESRLIFLARSNFDIGLPIGSTNDPFFGDGSFIKASLQGVLLHQLNNHVSLFSLLSGQISDRTLPSSEQYLVGGANRVRGSDTNLTRDSGVFYSQEVRTLLFQSKHHQFEFAPFFDIGYATNQSQQVFQDDLALASLGVVLRYQFANRLFASFHYAQPLLGRESFRDGSDFKFRVTARIF